MPISKPMKLIALRIAEEDKARLEQIAEEHNVTLSLALREGAQLYLSDLQEKVHRARGNPATFLGLRRTKGGRGIGSKTEPNTREAKRIASLDAALRASALGEIREGWIAGASPGLVFAALSHWLDLVSRVYSSREQAWSWFLIDYCASVADSEASKQFAQDLRRGIAAGVKRNPSAVIDDLEAAFLSLIDDLRCFEVVRRNVLPRWQVLQEELAL